MGLRRRIALVAACILIVALALTLTEPPNRGAIVPRSSSTATRAASYTYEYIDTPGVKGRAFGVSDDRTVVGYYVALNGTALLPFVYHHPTDLEATQLPLEQGFPFGVAYNISPDGRYIVGSEQSPGSPDPCYALLWTKTDGGYTPIRLVAGRNDFSNESTGTDCTSYGAAVTSGGTVYIHDGLTSGGGWVWTASTGAVHKDQLDVPGRTVATDGTRLVGNSTTASVVSPQGTTLSLQPLTAGNQASANAISLGNDETVGSSLFTGTPPPNEPNLTTVSHAVRWNADGSAVDLNDVTAYQSSEAASTVDPNMGWSNPEGVTLSGALGLNEAGDIVGSAYNSLLSQGQEAPMLLLAMPPVVIVPGVAASHLVSGTGQELWLNAIGDHSNLALSGPGSTPVAYADRVLQYETAACHFHFTCPADLAAYGPWMDFMHSNGFVDYQNSLQTACDTSQRTANPNLFTFAYDWRRDNADTAQGLARFMQCVRKFYTGPVVMVAHSMGGLVARRYILDQGAQSHVRELATIGTPWLGAPKLVNAMLTGEFASPIVLADTLQKVLPSMPGPRELLPSANYYQVLPTDQYGRSITPFAEAGWDINGNQTGVAYPTESYTDAQLHQLISTQVPGYDSVASAADAFHAVPGQDNWQTDTSNVHYTVMYGQQSVDRTIGQVEATKVPLCDSGHCILVDGFRTSIVPGDGTVPVVSSSRQGNGNDLNSPDPTHERLIAVSGSDDDLEHTGLTHNPEVDNEILYLDGRLGSDPVTDGPASPSTTLALARTGTSSGGGLVPASSVTSVADTQTGAGGWYADVRGFTGTTTISDPSGTSDAPQADTGDIRPELDGVTHENEGNGAELAITPVPTSGAYTDTFTLGQTPLAIDVRQGEQTTPSSRTGWQDLVLPAGSTVHLSLPASGTPTLSYSAPGSTDQIAVSPTTSLTGPEATYGTEPPTLQASAMVRNGTTYGVLSAASNGVAPVTGIRWSQDGVHFQTYTGPVALGPTSSTLSAFADDAAGNRSSVYTFDTSTMTAAPYTDATLVPQPGPSGFSAVPVTAVLQPHSSDGTTAVLHYTVYSPGGHAASEQTSTAPITRIVVSANGKTTIRYYTVDSTGAQETAQYLVIGVDTSSPAVAITSPATNATTAGFPAVSGTATDTASGVTGVKVEIRRNSDGQYWSGTAWQPGYATLPTSGTGTWQVPAASLPQGSNASPGAYTITATATSLSGTTGTGHVQITVSPSAVIRELAPPTSGFSSNNPTAALAVNSAGQVAGHIGGSYQGAYEYAILWNADGSATALDGGLDNTQQTYTGYSINDQGVAVGHGPGGAYVWWPNGAHQQLRYGGTGACANCDEARAINGSGVIVGQSVNRWGSWIGFGTGTGGTFVPLPVPPGPTSTMDALTFQPMGINSSGTVVGTRLVTGPDGRNRYVATETTTQSAHYLFPVTSESHAVAIDTAGDVVGSAVPAGASDLQPYIQTPDGTTTFIDLSGIGLGTGTATGINDDGEIVGTGADGNGASQPWIWRGGVAKRLADLLPAGSGWTLTDASGISSTGIVVGRGQLNGNQRGYALTPAGDLQLDTPIEAKDASATTPVDTAVTVPLVATTTRPLTWTLTQSPAHGTAALTGAQLTYTPDTGWTGTDTLGVQATDGVLTSNPATVTIQVGTPAAAPGAPVALIDAPAGVGDGATFTLDGSASFDPGGAPLTYVWSVADGTVTDPGAAITTASLSGPGPHLITLTVTGPGGSNTASATVTAAPVPAPNTSIAVTVTGSTTYGVSPTFDYSSQKLPKGVTLTGTVTCTGESDGTPVSPGQHIGSYTIDGTSCSGLSASAAGYGITYVGGSLTVSPAPLTAIVTGSQVYGSAQRSFAVSDWSGFVNGDSAATAVTGTLTGCSSTAPAGGPPTGYSDTITGCGGLSAADYLIGYQDGGFTITPAPLVITASSTAITYGQPIPAITPAYSGFAVGDRPDSLDTAPACSTTANGDSAAGAYATSCAGAVDPDYTISYAPGTVTVGRRSAVLAYTGPQLVNAATATASTAAVALTATVTPDSTDGYSGDLTHAAPVTFDLYSSANTAMTTPDAICTATQVTATGTSTCQIALAPDTWTVTVVEPANGYYAAQTSGAAVLTVYQPIPGSSVTGGGWVPGPATTASLPAAPTPHDNFGFTVRYHKGSNAPQGQTLYVFRTTDGFEDIVKSNSWQGGGLAISGNKATFMGKATLTVVDPATGQQIAGLGGGNYTFRVDVTDNGPGGSGDTYAISVYDQTGKLVHQNGSPTQQLALGGGNIAVRPA